MCSHGYVSTEISACGSQHHPLGVKRGRGAGRRGWGVTEKDRKRKRKREKNADAAL